MSGFKCRRAQPQNNQKIENLKITDQCNLTSKMAGPCGSFDPVGLKLRGTAGFEYRSGRMFVIEVVHIECFILFKGLACAYDISVHYKAPLKSFDKKRTVSWLFRKQCKPIFTHLPLRYICEKHYINNFISESDTLYNCQVSISHW